MKSFRFILAVAVTGLAFFTVPAEATSLREAVQLTVENNPTISALASNREAVDEELRQARGLYLPEVDVTAAVGPEWTNNSSIRANKGSTDDLFRQDAALTVRQRVFTGYDTNSRIEREKARAKSAANRVYENSEFLALDAIGAYLEVLRQRDLYALAKQNVDFHIDMVARLEQRALGGLGTSADVSQGKATLSRAQATLADVSTDLGDAEANYTKIVGQFPGPDLELPDFPSDSFPGSIETAVQLSSQANPTVRVRMADVEARDAEVGIAEATFYPTVDLEAQSGYDEDVDGVNTYEHQHNVLLRARWNLFRGGINRAARQEALMNVHEARNRRREAVLNANEEARRSWFAWEASKLRMRDLENAVVHSRETRDAYLQQFDVGQRSLLDLLSSENELFTARGQLVSAQVNYLRSGYRLLASTGQLLKTFDVAAPAQANPESEDFWSSMSFE